MSYSARLVLVNAVLLSLHVYWASIFLLPKTVIKQVEERCRNYLWGSEEDYRRVPLVAWRFCCQKKKEGGLGIRDSVKWNIAAVGKLVWDLASKKDVLWVKWVDSIYLKGVSIWQYQPKAENSWYWKRLHKVKEQVRSGYMGGTWIADASGTYSLKSGYQFLGAGGNFVPWCGWVWSSYNMAKHSFICWLVVWDRLLTKERLSRFAVVQEKCCLLCNGADETVSHLFFECAVSGYLVQCMKEWLGWRARAGTIRGLTRWICDRSNWPKKRKKMNLAMMCHLVYFIWRLRNQVLHEHCLEAREQCWRKLKHKCMDQRYVWLGSMAGEVDGQWLLQLC